MRSEEAQALDREVLAVIEAWHERGEAFSDDAFDDLAIRIFAYQLRYNEPYARYCAARGVTSQSMPSSWEEIPPIPAAAFKEAALTTFEPAEAALSFETSGTTLGTGGRHYMEAAALYDAALLAGYDHFMLPDRARLRYLNLVPNPQDRPQSSLGYMMARVARERGAGKTGWYLRGENLFFDAFFADLHESVIAGQALCIATTAFALAVVLDAADERGLRFTLPSGSRIMETGGFKGRTRAFTRAQLYARTSSLFGIEESQIVAEYGMTELTSQYYDSSVIPSTTRLKSSPPWLRGRAVGPDGKRLPDGVVGALVHVDLANRSSCIAIETEDLGAAYGRDIVLLGREAGAELRGCSLDAETLLSRRSR
jgi:hypothetical protein